MNSPCFLVSKQVLASLIGELGRMEEGSGRSRYQSVLDEFCRFREYRCNFDISGGRVEKNREIKIRGEKEKFSVFSVEFTEERKGMAFRDGASAVAHTHTHTQGW